MAAGRGEIEAPPGAGEAARAAVFERHRRLLRGLAYSMLGSMADAEDVVQETFLRWRAAELAELGESLTTAFLLLLERLRPAERAALLLHEVLDLSHAEVARVLGRTEPACRQLLARARRRLAGRMHPPMPSSPGQGVRAEAFFTALHAADVPALMAVLTEDAQAWSDGGSVVTAARRVIRGAGRVARFLAGIVRKESRTSVSLRSRSTAGPAGCFSAGRRWWPRCRSSSTGPGAWLGSSSCGTRTSSERREPRGRASG